MRGPIGGKGPVRPKLRTDRARRTRRSRQDARPTARSAPRNPARHRAPARPEIELECTTASNRMPSNAACKVAGIEASEAKSIGADRAGEHDLQTVRAAGEIVQRLRVGFARVGMVEAGDDPPRTASARSGARPLRWRIERLDPACRRRSWRRACRRPPLSARLRLPSASRPRPRPGKRLPPRPTPASLR